MIEFLILYFPLVPFWSHFLMDLFTYIRKFQFEKKFNTNELKSHLKILDPSPLLNLGQIEHIFLDKTGTITQNDFKIKDIYYDSKLYNFHSKKFVKLIEKNQNELFKKNAFSSKKYSDFPNINTNCAKKEVPSPETIEIPKKDCISPSLISDFTKKEPSNSDFQAKNENALNDFIEVPTYTLEKYSPQKSEEPKNINVPNQLPKSNPIKHFPLEKKKQMIYFLKNNVISGDVMEDEDNSAHAKFTNLKPATKKLQKTSEDNLFFNDFHPKKTGGLKISFDLSFEKNHHFLNSSNSSLRSLLLNDNNRIKKYSPCTEEDFISNLIQNSDYFDPLFEALTICHSAKLSNNNEILSVRLEDDVMLKFSSLCGHKLEKTNFSNEVCEYHIRAHQRKAVYNIYHVSEFRSDSQNFSILYQEPRNFNQAILLTRASLGYIKKRLVLLPDELENLELAVKEFYLKGLIPLIYAKKTIDPFETKELLDKLNILKSSPINYSADIRLLISEYEKDLIFIGIVGIKDKLNDSINETMNFFQEIDQRIWIVSGDSRENCLSTALSLKFIEFNENFYEIEGENKAKLISSFQNHLEDIKENVFAMNSKSIYNVNNERTSILKGSRKSISNFFRIITKTLQNAKEGVSYILENKYILLNGQSLEIIMRDDYLNLNFIFLVSLIKKFVCYNMKPAQKAFLVDIVQTKLINNPKVLAIGDGWNDALMLQKAAIGIEYIHTDLKGGLINAGDIQITNMKIVKDLLLEGFMKISVMEQIILYLFYKTYLVVLPLFLFNWHCNFTATNLYNESFLLLTDLLFSIHNIAVFFLCEEPITKDFLDKYPFFYKDSRSKKHQILLRFFLGAAVEGFLQGSFIFYLTFYSCGEGYGPNGMELDLKFASTAIVISLCFVSNLRIFMDTENRKSKLLMSFCPMTIILMFFFFYVNEICFLFACYTDFINLGFTDFVSNTSMFICILGNILFSLSSHFLIRNFLFKKYGHLYQLIIPSANLEKTQEILKKIIFNPP